MQKTGVIITTIIAFLVVGGLIVALSVYKKSAVRPETTRLMSFTDDNFQEDVV